jgi:haloacetate dehalogenase
MSTSREEAGGTESSRREFLGASLAALIGSAAAAGAAHGATPEAGNDLHAGRPLRGSTPGAWSLRGSPPAPSGLSAPHGRSTLDFFPGFEPLRIETSETVIRGVKGGSGPPLLLLHGYPQSHLEWHRVAPRLAERFTVVATDLRGYGDSDKPEDGAEHAGYSKRAMARDQVEVMDRLGFERFAVVGHDRGGRVAHRLVLDHPERVSRLAVIDIVPTHHVFANVNRALATSYYHWFFMLQPAPFPETLYGSNADFVLRNGFFRGLVPSVIPNDVYAEYLRCFADPATQHAMCEDYRAAAGIDLAHDEADLDRRVTCPLLVIWGAYGVVGRLYDVLAVWRERAADARGRALPGGHWLPEQRPDETLADLLPFLTA